MLHKTRENSLIEMFQKDQRERKRKAAIKQITLRHPNQLSFLYGD